MNHSKTFRSVRTLWAVLAALVLATAVLAACDIPEFDPPNQLKHDRFLAIQAEPREPAPGDTVTVRALVVHSDGTTYKGPVAWVVTGIAGFSVGAEGQELPQGDVYIQQPNGPEFTFTIPQPEDFEEHYGIPYQADGTVLTIGAAAGDPDAAEDALIALKSLVVMDTPEKENPVFNKIRIQRDGADVEPDEYGVTRVGNVATLKLIADVDFATRGDNVSFHWYTATEGIEFSVDKAVEWKLPKQPGYYHVYCVARENSPTIFDDGQYRIQSAGIAWAHEVIEITSGF